MNDRSESLRAHSTPSSSLLPFTPFVSMMFSAALVTVRFKDSLPTLFILLEFRDRFCLVLPKASMQESNCVRNKPSYQGQAGQHGCFVFNHKQAVGSLSQDYLTCQLGWVLPHTCPHRTGFAALTPSYKSTFNFPSVHKDLTGIRVGKPVAHSPPICSSSRCC